MSETYLGAQEARTLIGRFRGGGGGGGWRGGGGGFMHGVERHHGRRGGFGGVDGGGGWGGPWGPWGGGDVTQEVQVDQPQWPGAPGGEGGDEWRRRQEWERAHPGGDWHARERKRREWEHTNPGVPFVGAEALYGAWQSLVGRAIAGDPVARTVVGEIASANPTLAAAAAAGIGPRAVLAPSPAPTLASRQGLPMNSGTFAFGYLDTALITSRPQRQAFRPERVFISPPIAGPQIGPVGAQSWFVNDITIGNKSQLVQSGGLPGDMFANESIDSFVTFETAQTAMDVTMSITLIQNGIQPEPFFYGGIIGTAAI
jgi:hypothetical protein